MSTVIGLSFGNTSSSIAYIKENKVEVIANPDGDRAIPSMLSYANGDEYHGLQAKQQLVRNAANTVAFFRDFVGVPFADIDAKFCAQSAKPHAAADGSVAFTLADQEVSINDVIKRQLAQLHHAGRDYIGREIDGIVFAVPSNWSKAQVDLIKSLAAEAGLPVVQVITEHSAALLAHSSRPDLADDRVDKVVVVADFGGTRSDGAVVAFNGGVQTTLATAEAPGLGGKNLDDKLVAHLASEFKNQTGQAIDFASEPRAVAKLHAEAESLKKTLSNSTTTQFGIESLSGGLDFSGSLTRLKLEVIGRDFFAHLAKFVAELLEKSKLTPLDIDEVLLVGGASWTPKVATVVRSVFDDNERVIVRAPVMDPRAVDPDELIARGCAIEGSLVSGLDAEEITTTTSDSRVIQGPHLSKGIGYVDAEGQVVPVLHPLTLLPIRRSVAIKADGPVLIRVVEIEREVETRVHKPEPKPEAAGGDDDESDWSEDEDEEYETKHLVLKPGQPLAELALTASGSVDLVVGVTAELQLQISARSGSESVGGRI